MSRETDLAAQRTVVRELWEKNIRKPSEILKITNYPKSAVYNLIKKLKERGILEPHPIPGRPSILSPKNRRHLGLLIQNNQSISAVEMKERLTRINPNLKITPALSNVTLKKTLNILFADHKGSLFLSQIISFLVLSGVKVTFMITGCKRFFRTKLHFRCFRILRLYDIVTGTIVHVDR